MIVSMEDPGCITLGAERKFANDGSLDVYWFYSLIAREWKNPYVLNREATHADEYGVKASYDNVAGSGLFLSYKLTAKHVGQDVSGSLHPELLRNGMVHNATVGYQVIPFLEPGVSFERGMFEGRSNSYDYRELFLRLNYQDGDFSAGSEGGGRKGLLRPGESRVRKNAGREPILDRHHGEGRETVQSSTLFRCVRSLRGKDTFGHRLFRTYGTADLGRS